MSRLLEAVFLGILFFALAATGGAQIRNVTINTESDEGKLLQRAGDESDPAKKAVVLEEFLSKYGSHDAAGYVHYQLLVEYSKSKDFDKALQHGEKAQEKAPGDLEVAHLMVKAAEGKGDVPALVGMVEKAHGLAQKVKATPKPSDSDEAEAWKKNTEFADQVDQYNQYALFQAAQTRPEPQARVAALDALRKNFPGGQFDKNLDALYVVAYQQLGQNDKMTEAAAAALATDPTNETYLYLVGESYTDPNKGKVAEAQASAQKILDTLASKPKPANLTDDAWAQHKNTYTGLAHSLLGRSLAIQGKFAPAAKELLAAAASLKGNNDALAPVYFYLGFCSVKLERHRDAVNYLAQASKIPGPYQAPANDMLTKVRAALGGK